MEILKIYTRRSHYSVEDAAAATLTVGRLREILDEYEDDTPVITTSSNDFCKYGTINPQNIELDYTEE
jgi:ABC-type uncharacterized transport system involved in gliding motility auxiliary subunit